MQTSKFGSKINKKNCKFRKTRIRLKIGTLLERKYYTHISLKRKFFRENLSYKSCRSWNFLEKTVEILFCSDSHNAMLSNYTILSVHSSYRNHRSDKVVDFAIVFRNNSETFFLSFPKVAISNVEKLNELDILHGLFVMKEVGSNSILLNGNCNYDW